MTSHITVCTIVFFVVLLIIAICLCCFLRPKKEKQIESFENPTPLSRNKNTPFEPMQLTQRPKWTTGLWATWPKRRGGNQVLPNYLQQRGVTSIRDISCGRSPYVIETLTNWWNTQPEIPVAVGTNNGKLPRGRCPFTR